ncbi:Acetylcholinesterase [Penicillium rolfsii]|nr:Acetylcholinesterase [Penicillium rolfsii]
MLKIFAIVPVIVATFTVTLADKLLPPYFQDLKWEAPRSLSNWSNLTVETRTGTFIGMLNDTYPNVRQFLRVPFAQPPVGDLRWMPPQKLPFSSRKYDATIYGPACPQYVQREDSFWKDYEPASFVVNPGENLTQGSVAWSTAEDCLSIAIWTPASANKTSKLPVTLFATGGAGVEGGIWIPAHMPTQWVSRSQEHIAIALNYRVNIFGNPKSRALKETSLSLLDVRAAVEWIHENIEAFGGDPDNIFLWGQSQGGALTHLYTLAFPDDPLVASYGIISQEPGTTLDLSTGNDPYLDFDIVAKALGCNYGDDAEAELNCMRMLSWVHIEEYINRYQGTPPISFMEYIPDEKYIFSNETLRYLEGKVANGPAIRSFAAREIAVDDNITTSQADAHQWVCLAASDTALRYSQGLDTYRYFWAGNPVPWLGAFHYADLLMIFGTYVKNVGEISQLELETANAMQDYLLAFIKDPSTVSQTVGWPLFDPTRPEGGLVIEFGKDVPARNITGQYLDGGCYNSSIPFRVDG